MRHYFLLFFTLSSWLFSGETVQAIDHDSPLIWLALFGLATVSMIMMFILSQQTQKIKKQHKKILKNRKEIEETESRFLNSIKQEAEKVRRGILQHKMVDDVLGIEENSISEIEAKSKFLDTTESLIAYLKLKSESLEIKKQSFNVNNMLNELAGSLATEFPDSGTDLIFDMDNTIPRVLIGDSVHIGQVLASILKYCLQETPQGEVKLEITLFHSYDEEYEMQFKITDSSIGISNEVLKTLFVPEYDEHNYEYKNLEFFVASKLVSLMNGDFTVQSTKDKGNIFIFTLPITQVNMVELRRYRLPDKTLTHKKVLIVEESYQSGLAAKKMLSYFRHHVKVLSTEDFFEQRPDIENYNILIMNEKLFGSDTNRHLRKIKADHVLKVVALKSIFNTSDIQATEGVIDHYLNKPFSQEQIFEMIIALYDVEKNPEDNWSKGAMQRDKENAHKDSFIETPHITIESFKNFSGASILIVEDNIINQKVLKNILGKASMDLVVANNGEEAVDIIKSSPVDRFDMVLMDVNMPVLDGYEATKRIREESTYDRLPIVALSALVLDNEIRKMFQSGVNGYLQKPINIGMLYSAFDVHVTVKSDTDEVIYPMVSDFCGINIKQGIAYTNDNIALYKEVLDAFVSAYGNSYQLVESLSEKKKYEEMEKLCLDMKGLTGTIGAYKMNDLVDRMYRSLHARHYHYIPELITEYRSEFPRLSNAIRNYIR